MIWNYFFNALPNNTNTFIVRQNKYSIYFARIVKDRICTCHVFQNLNNMTVESVYENGISLKRFVEMHETMGNNIEWSYFEMD